MRAYNILFTDMFTIFVMSLLAVTVVSYFATRGRYLFPLFFYNYGPSFAIGYYLVLIIKTDSLSFDHFAVLFLETINLIIIAVIFYKMKIALEKSIKHDWDASIQRITCIQVVFFLPLLLNSDFGLFSAGSRIDYLSSSFLAKYLTYGGVLLAAVLAVAIAGSISEKSTITVWSITAISVNIVLSLLAGSKGGVFLWVVSIFALTNWRGLKLLKLKFVALGIFLVTSIVYTIYELSKALNLDFLLILKLISSRFFLNNDARALAFDLREETIGSAIFINEAFRSFARIFGEYLHEVPLGVRLYQEGLLITNGNGANTGLTPLIIAYFDVGYAILPVLIFTVFLLFMYCSIEGLFCNNGSVVKKLYYRAFMLQLFVVLLQDFLALLALLPMFLLFATFLKIKRSRIIL